VNTTRRAAATLFEVPLDDGTSWTGTEAELRRDHPEWVKYARAVQPARTTREDYDVGEPDEPPYTRLPSSAVRLNPIPGKKRIEYDFQPGIVHTSIPPRRSAQRQPHPNMNRAQPPDVIHAPPAQQRYTEEPKQQKRRSRHWLLYVGVGMLAMLALWVGLQRLGDWWQLHQDDATYGYPRTFQCNAVVGHNGDSRENPSHFIFLNLHGHVEVIEIPAGDATKEKVYILPMLVTDGYDLIPVTGEFRDVNGDGKPDMIVKIQDQRIVFINTGDGFRPLKPGEHVTLPQN
jgi:hypothetical protein